ncbi:MAG: hypothetical protein BWK79_20140 [Beggiatoa sp. IS2]|nr:MAG: hypothetical protein BWK79_20140 [Beggiatoa sp. IS2]
MILNITDDLGLVGELASKIVTRTDKKIVVAMPAAGSMSTGTATLRFECTSGRSTQVPITIGTSSA